MSPAVESYTKWGYSIATTTGTVVISTIIDIIVIGIIVQLILHMRQYNLHLLHLLYQLRQHLGGLAGCIRYMK